jgi:hypothetical protein
MLAGRCVRTWLLSLWGLVLSVGALTAHAAHAQVGPRALPALFATPRLTPTGEVALLLAGSLGYGLREALGSADALHHTGLGALGVAVAAPFGLSAELRLDGRYEKHSARGDRGTGQVGELRAYLRYAHAAGARLRIGAELGVWVPGSRAPSFRFGATTLDGLLVFDTQMARDWSLSVAPGFRLDRSGRAMSDADVRSLSTGDYVTLGLSDANALLVRAGVERAFPRGQLFLECTWDAYLGKQAARLSRTPMQAALGGRASLDQAGRLSLTASVRALVNARPTLDREAALTPFPPRAELWVGLRYELTRTRAVAAAEPVRDESAPPAQSAPVAPPPQPPLAPAAPAVHVEPELVVPPAPAIVPGQLRLLIRDHRSGEPLRAEVRVHGEDEAAASQTNETADAEGRLRIELPKGRYTVTIKLKGYRKQIKQLTIEDESVTMLDVALHARSKR